MVMTTTMKGKSRRLGEDEDDNELFAVLFYDDDYDDDDDDDDGDDDDDDDDDDDAGEGDDGGSDMGSGLGDAASRGLPGLGLSGRRQLYTRRLRGVPKPPENTTTSHVSCFPKGATLGRC